MFHTITQVVTQQKYSGLQWAQPEIWKRRARVGGLLIACLAMFYLVALIYPDLGDVRLYYQYSQSLLAGQYPYRDFDVEYPPMAFLSFLGPYILAGSRTLSFEQYCCFFLSTNAAFSIAIAVSLLYIRRWSGALAGRSAVSILKRYLVLSTLLGFIIAWRYDLAPALFVMLAFAAIASQRPAWGGVFLGVAIASKLYAVALLPFIWSYYAVNQQRSSLAKFMIAASAVFIVSLAPLTTLPSSAALSFLKYHQERGLQIESIPASLVLIGRMMGLTTAKVIYSHSSFGLDTPGQQGMLNALPWIFILFMGAATLFCLREFRREYLCSGAVSIASLCKFATIGLVLFICANKVFSPQYLIWLLPFLTLVRRPQFVLCISFFAMTVAIYPLSYAALIQLSPYAISLLAIRNACLIILIYWLLAERVRVSRDDSSPDAQASSAS